jgi:hypothetical protein
MYVWELYSLVGFRLDGWHFDCRGAIYRVVYCALSFLFFSEDIFTFSFVLYLLLAHAWRFLNFWLDLNTLLVWWSDLLCHQKRDEVTRRL